MLAPERADHAQLDLVGLAVEPLAGELVLLPGEGDLVEGRLVYRHVDSASVANGARGRKAGWRLALPVATSDQEATLLDTEVCFAESPVLMYTSYQLQHIHMLFYTTPKTYVPQRHRLGV